MRREPEILRHDAQLWRIALEPLPLGPAQIALHAPAITLLDPIPDHHAAVERPADDLANGRGRPTVRTPRRRDLVLVQGLRNPRDALALGAQREDAPDDGGLFLVHAP